MNQYFPVQRLIVALALVTASGGALLAAPQQAARHLQKAATEAVAGEVVAYKDLERYVGATIVVETTLGTTHRGVLVKYTNPALVLRLGPQMGSIDLTVPQETVRRSTVVEPATKPAAGQGSDSAEKN